MSDKLTLSAALSVLLMSGFVLFSPATARVPLGPQAVTMELPAPSISLALPGLR